MMLLLLALLSLSSSKASPTAFNGASLTRIHYSLALPETAGEFLTHSNGIDHAYPFGLFAGGDNETDQHGLWAIDGTDGGSTFLLEFDTYRTIIPRAYRYMGKSYLSFFDDSSLEGLWVTDGTATNTEQLLTAAADEFVEFQDLLFFASGDGSFDALWKTDGTTSGTEMVYQFEEFSSIRDIGVGNGYLLIAVNMDEQGSEVYRSDGTTSGTLLLSSKPEWARVRGRANAIMEDGSVLFRDQHSLWRTDGTASGTFNFTSLPFADITAETINGQAFARYRSDGGFYTIFTSAGTTDTTFPLSICNEDGSTAFDDASIDADLGLADVTCVKSLETTGVDGFGNAPAFSGSISLFSGVYDGRMMFRHDGFGSGAFEGTQLWLTDGSADGTEIIAFISSMSLYRRQRLPGGRLLLLGYGDETNEVWITDGTASGTQLLVQVEDKDGLGLGHTSIQALDDSRFLLSTEDGIWRVDIDGPAIVPALPPPTPAPTIKTPVPVSASTVPTMGITDAPIESTPGPSEAPVPGPTEGPTPDITAADSIPTPAPAPLVPPAPITTASSLAPTIFAFTPVVVVFALAVSLLLLPVL